MVMETTPTGRIRLKLPLIDPEDLRRGMRNVANALNEAADTMRRFTLKVDYTALELREFRRLLREVNMTAYAVKLAKRPKRHKPRRINGRLRKKRR